MSRRGGPERTVMLCHDCCCGTFSKHPDVDHDTQRDRLLALGDERTRVRVVDCLDECDRSNVVVVRDHAQKGARRDTWLGGVLDPAATDALVDWIEAGGPRPQALDRCAFKHVPPARR